MKINIPCDECGCQTCDAKTNSGKNCQITICKCSDNESQFDVIIEIEGEIENEIHICDEKDLSDCLGSRFNINIDSMTHKCN